MSSEGLGLGLQDTRLLLWLPSVEGECWGVSNFLLLQKGKALHSCRNGGSY